MKKYFLLIACLFILTGCDASYELVIDDVNSTESIIAKESESNHNEGIDMYIEPYEYYSDIALPVSKKDGTELTMEGKKNNINYYKVSQLSDQFGLKFVGNLGSQSISNSNIISSQTKKGQFKDNTFSWKVDISKLDVFKNYPILDNLTISITVNDGKVIKNNADSVAGKTYTWYINRSNYKDKPIELQIRKSSQLVFHNIANNNIKIIIVSIIIILLFFSFIYYVFKRRVNNYNE